MLLVVVAFFLLVLVLGVLVAIGIVALSVLGVASVIYGTLWLIREYRRRPQVPPHVRARVLEIRATNERAELSRRRQSRGYRTTYGRHR